MYRSAPRCACLTLIGVLGIILVGCGDGRPRRVLVSGQVLIDGKPLEHGFVQVVPAGDRAANGKLGPGGRFTLETFDPKDGCVPGRHGVAIIGLESINAASQRWHAPKKYMTAETSGLHVNIEGPTDDLKIEISWEGGAPFMEGANGETFPSGP